MAAEPQVVVLREINPEEAACVFCANLVPDHCEMPYEVCPPHFTEMKKRIEASGVTTNESRTGDELA